MVGPGSNPLDALFLVAAAVLACRWVFGERGVRRVNRRPDYGLLTPVLRTDALPDAEGALEQLAAAGIRATVAPAGAGFTSQGRPWPPDARMVLVFPPDAAAAEQVLHPHLSR
jgi:hypothetical protein